MFDKFDMGHSDTLLTRAAAMYDCHLHRLLKHHKGGEEGSWDNARARAAGEGNNTVTLIKIKDV